MNKVVRAAVAVSLLAGSLVALTAASSNAATPVDVPQSTWAVKLAQATSAPTVLSPTGDVAVASCPQSGVDFGAQPAPVQVLDGVGDTRFEVGITASSTCTASMLADSAGNWYIPVTPDPQGTPWDLRAVTKTGAEIWTRRMAGLAYTGPRSQAAVGFDGHVYFTTVQGPGYTIEGFSMADGTPNTNQKFSSIRAFSIAADPQGLVIAHSGGVRYSPYDGSAPVDVPLPHMVMSSDTWLDGVTFASGYSDDCSTLYVYKVGHGGIVWTFEAPAVAGCRQTSLRATPDGGVILARNNSLDPSYDYMAIKADRDRPNLGTAVWARTVPVPGPGYNLASSGSGYISPLVDEDGTVVVYSMWVKEPDLSLEPDAVAAPIAGLSVEFLSQTSGNALLPKLTITDTQYPGWFTNTTMTSGTDRLYVTLDAGYPNPSALAAFTALGLKRDARALMRPGTPVAPLCADVMFFAARGSGEPGPGTFPTWDPTVDDPKGVGGTLLWSLQAFERNLPAGTSVDLFSLPYPASSVAALARGGDNQKFFAGIETGVDRLKGELDAAHALCPDQRVVIAGYSQGAMVTRRAYERMLAAPYYHDIITHIDAVLLIADGDRHSRDGGEKLGTMTAGRNGVARVKPYKVFATGVGKNPLPLTVRVVSVCNKNDFVCDQLVPAKQFFTAIGIHTAYNGSGVAARGGASAADRVAAALITP